MGPAFLHGCVEGEQQLQTWALCHSWDPNTYQATAYMHLVYQSLHNTVLQLHSPLAFLPKFGGLVLPDQASGKE
nr:hypothetical protein Iba_chr06bCG14230 [Ipomoea batatas]